MNKHATLIKIFTLTAFLIWFTETICMASFLPNPGENNSGSNNKTRRTVMVVIDQVSWDDITGQKLPVIRKIIDSGAVGLMTTNPGTGGLRTPEHTYTTIGAGAKILGGDASGQGFNVLEEYENGRADNSYYRRTGKIAKGEVVNLGIAQIETVNQSFKYSCLPGAVGTVLHNYGLKTGILGNSDVLGVDEKDRFRRFAVNIAMDRYGQVDYGEVGSSCLIPDNSFLGGIRTDYDFLLKKFRQIKSKADFLVIETGDMSRLENQATVASPEALGRQKEKALSRIDFFLGNLLKEIDFEKDLLMIVVPGPSAESMEKGDFLTPFIMTGHGVEPGIVYSGTTKRQGLISNTDIGTTIVEFFGFPPVVKETGDKKDVTFNGQVIEGIPSANPISEISVLKNEIVFMHNARYPFVKTYINLCLITLAVSVAALVLDIKGRALIKAGLVAVTFIPAVFLLADFMTDFSQLTAALLTGIITVVLVLVSVHVSKILRFSPFMISSGVTAALLIFDIFSGGNLSRTSPLSYDATAGARFYGIGNEYMGVLIGAALTFITLAIEKLRSGISYLVKLTAILICLIVVYTISAPNLGTNAGGAIAAVAGLGTAGITFFGKQFNIKTVIPIAAFTASLLAAFVIFDFTRSVETQSHMGRTVGLIQQNGITEIFNIISRKSEVNLKLIRYTSWSWYFFLSLGVIVFRNRLFSSEIRQWERQFPWFKKMLPAYLVSCLSALIFNDSGVVAAATMISFGVPPLLWELIRIKERTVQ